MNIIERLKGIDWKNFSILSVLKGCNEHYFKDYLDRGEEYNKIVAYRLKLCNSCPLFTNNTCDPTKQLKHVTTGKMISGCGCNISCKTALKDAECPIGKWSGIQ